MLIVESKKWRIFFLFCILNFLVCLQLAHIQLWYFWRGYNFLWYERWLLRLNNQFSDFARTHRDIAEFLKLLSFRHRGGHFGFQNKLIVTNLRVDVQEIITRCLNLHVNWLNIIIFLCASSSLILVCGDGGLQCLITGLLIHLKVKDNYNCYNTPSKLWKTIILLPF